MTWNTSKWLRLMFLWNIPPIRQGLGSVWAVILYKMGQNGWKYPETINNGVYATSEASR